MFSNVLLFSLSGVIGVGKSTLIRKLRDENLLSFTHPTKTVKVCYVLEKSAKWKTKGWLQRFYESPDSKSLSFQLLVFDSHVKSVEKELKRVGADDPNTIVVCIVERSMWDQLLFWKLQIDLNRSTAQDMDDEAYMAIWKRWYRFVPPVRMIFYCVAPIEVTMERIAKRGEACEQQGVSLEYQTALTKKHEQWYKAPQAHFTLGDVHTGINCKHIPMGDAVVDVELIRSAIEKFVHTVIKN